MKYTFDEIKEKGIWNSFAQKFENVTFIDSWQWGEFRSLMGEKFLNYGIYRSGVLVGLLPISIVNAKRGKYIHLRHAPLLDWDDAEMIHESVAFLRDIASENGSWFIRISPLLLDNEHSEQLLKLYQFTPSKAHEVDAEHTLIIDLTQDEETILSQMRKNTRYSIRKAKKLGVEIEIYTDLSKFDQFYEIFNDAVIRNQWVTFSKDYLKKEFEIFAKDDKASMFFAKYEGEYIASAIFTYFAGQSAYHHSGSLTKFRHIPSSYLLQWEAIRYAKEKGYTEHNLWGVVDKDDAKHPWYGLSLFKWGFGGTDRKIIHAHDLILSPLAHATRLYEMIESKKNGY